MNNDEPVCEFCGESTKRKRKDALDVGTWGGNLKLTGDMANFCDNPACDSYGEQVATR